MKRCFRFGAMAVAAAAIQANALDVTLAPSGEVRFGGDASPCVLRPAAALPGWRSLSCKGGWTIALTFADNTTRTAQIDIQTAGFMLIVK